MTKCGRTSLSKRRLGFTTALAGIGVALLAAVEATRGPASAQVRDWTGAVSENWFDAGNWAGGGVPDQDSEVVIDTATPNPAVIGTAGLAEALSLVVGDSGSGALTLSGGGLLEVGLGAGTVTLASQAGSSGTLYFGAGSADPAEATAPTLLLADSIGFGAGTGTLVFNHDSASFALTADITGSGTVRFVSGTTGLVGNSTYSGATVISGGTVVAGTDSALSVNSDYTVGGGAKLELFSNVFAQIGSLSGAGTVELGIDSSLLIAGTGRNTVFSGSIVGAGDFYYDASSTLVLTGDSQIGGLLEICSCSSGLLEIQGGSFTTGFETIVTGGSLAVTQGGRLTTSNFLIVEDGSLRVDGPGSRITVDGPTIVSALFGRGVMEISNGGVVVTQDFAEVDSFGFGGPAVALVTGSGSHWHTEHLGISTGVGGEGMLTLTEGGSASASSGTEIASAGILRFGTGGLAGSLDTPTLVNDGAIVANFTDSLELSADISGGGSLTKRGPGTLILTGSNSYTGATTVRDGTLQVDTDSLPGDVANDGLVVFDQDFDGTYANVVSGSGSLGKSGSGLLVLAGANSYGGSTTVSAGTLRPLSDAALPDGSAVTVANLALLDLGGVDQTIGSLAGEGDVSLGTARLTTGGDGSSTTFSGRISGSGGLTKDGDGTMVLAGTNSYTGTTLVEAGMLVVNGSLASPVTVGANGRIGGTGRLGGGLEADGRIAPGNSIGTLTVDGDVTFGAGSVYEVEVDPGSAASDLIRVTGTASLQGASVLHVGEDGDYRPFATYTILTADDGLSGTFDGVSSSFAFLDPSLRYDTNSVYLTLTRNDTSFASLTTTGNQAATATAVQSLGAGEPVYDAVVTLPDQASARQAFNALSGELHASLADSLLEDSAPPREAAFGRLRQAFAERRNPSQLAMAGADDLAATPARGRGVATWAQAFGSWGSLEGDGNAATLDRSMGGILLGADAEPVEDWRLGLFTGYDRRDLQVDDRRASATIDTIHLGLYGGTELGPISLSLGAAYAWHSVETERSVIFPGFSESLEADYGANTAQLFGEAGYRFRAGPAALQPFASLAWVRVETDGFTEEGGASALTADGADSDLLYSTLGSRVATSLSLPGLPEATLHGMAGWRHAFGDTAPGAAFAFSGGDAFTIDGVPAERDSAVLQAGLAARLGESATLGVSYDGRLGARSQDHGVSLDLSLRF